MSTTEIIRVPVDDSEFTRFAKAFGDWRDRVKEMPADWQNLNARIGAFAKTQQAAGVSADKAWANATKAAQDYERAVKSATKANQHLGSGISNAAAAMKKMAAEGKALSGHLFGAVRFAAKLGTFGLGGSLIGLAAGGFGLDALAGNVLRTQRTARGLGLTSGELRSYQTNMARYAGIGALTGAAEAQVSPDKLAWLSVLGISPRTAANEPATALVGQELLAAHKAWRAMPSRWNPQVMALEQAGLSLGEIRNAGAASRKSLLAAIGATARDASALGWSNQTQRDWAQFDIAMKKAGALIETALINTLTPLTPQLTKLSREIASFITGLEKSGTVKHWVDDLAGGLKSAAEWLGSPAFKQDMRQIAYDFQWLAKKLSWVFPSAPAAPGVNNPLNMKDTAGKWMGFDSQRAGIIAAYEREMRYPKEYNAKTMAQIIATWNGHGKNTPQYVAYLAKHTGLNPNSPLPFADTKKMAAFLHWQSAYEGHPVPEKAIYADLMSIGRPTATKEQPAHGLLAAPANAVAIHDARVRAILAEQAERAYTKKPEPSRAPAADTGGYAAVMRRLSRQRAQTPTVNVTVTNNTAANVHVSANAAAR